MSSQVTISTGKRMRRPSTTKKRTRAGFATGKKSNRKSVVQYGRGFPDKTITTMRYWDYSLVTATSLTVVGSWYRANGIFDPQVAIGGHQPLGFDQWIQLYDHWVVKSSRIKCTFAYRDEVDDVVSPVVCGIYDDDDGSNSLSYSALIEGCDRPKIDTLTTNNDKVVLYSKWKNTKTFGPASASDSRQTGTNTADPTEASNWFVFVYNLGGVGHFINITYDIEYTVEFFERRDLAGS